MANLMIRNLDDRVKHALRRRAADHGVSMEQEARNILTRETLGKTARQRPPFEEIMKLAKKPLAPVDSKQAQDELWAYLYDDDRR